MKYNENKWNTHDDPTRIRSSNRIIPMLRVISDTSLPRSVQPANWVVILLFVCIISACTGSNDTAEKLGIAGSWETDLAKPDNGSGSPALKGRVTFSGNQFVYSWLELPLRRDGRVGEWRVIAKEQGNISSKADALQLMAVAYGVSNGAKSSKEIFMEPVRNDYLIEYKIDENHLIWMEDYNLDGDFSDVGDVAETLSYIQVAK